MVEKKFEVAMKRLEEIVQGMEGNDLPLEDALRDFEEGVGLVKFCSKKLEEAEKKVTILIQESGGKHRQVPFDLEEEKDAE
ncbi:MAG: exodeoxyribonuclease VII small subunit [Desulfatiglandaceae bacterium]